MIKKKKNNEMISQGNICTGYSFGSGGIYKPMEEKSDLQKFTDLLDELGIEYLVNEPNDEYKITSRWILLVDGWGMKTVYHFDPKTNMVLREENRNKFIDEED